MTPAATAAGKAAPAAVAHRGEHRAARRRHARAGVCGLAVTVLALLACGGGLLAAPPAHAFNQEITRRAKVAKLKAFERRFGTPPQLLILGSSRAMRADPAQLRKALGVKGFNASVSSGTIPDAYAFLELTKRRYPEARPAVLWLLDIEVLRLSGYQPYLLSVPPLVRCLPKGGPGRPAARPHSLPWDLAQGNARGGRVVRPRFHADGLMTFWWHDLQRAAGRGTMAGVRYQEGGYASIYANHGWSGLTGSAKWFATEIVKQANAMGVTPVIVLTPYHPELRRFIAGRGWNTAYRQVRRFLRQLDERFDLRLVDLTSLSSFGGWPNGFYDGVHPRQPMMRAMLRRVIRKARPYLTPGVPPPPAPSPTTAAAGRSRATAAIAEAEPAGLQSSSPPVPAVVPEAHAVLPPELAREAAADLPEPLITLLPGAAGQPEPRSGAAPDGVAAAEAGLAGADDVQIDREPRPWLGAPSALPSAWPTPPTISVN
jgi:hypothetical protein